MDSNQFGTTNYLIEKYGAGYKVRTRDPLITNQVLSITTGYHALPYIAIIHRKGNGLECYLLLSGATERYG